MKIYKYVIPDLWLRSPKDVKSVQVGRGLERWIEMPTGAEILSVGAQGKNLVVWAACEPTAEQKQLRGFRLYYTGWEFNETERRLCGWSFLGTVQIHTETHLKCGVMKRSAWSRP
jgi:hypothetical protein